MVFERLTLLNLLTSVSLLVLSFGSVTLMPLVLQLWRHAVLHFDGLCGANGPWHRVMGYILSGVHKEGNVICAFLSSTLVCFLPTHNSLHYAYFIIAFFSSSC